MHRLCRAHKRYLVVALKYLMYGFGLHYVVRWRPGPVSIDVIHLCGSDTRILQGPSHRSLRSLYRGLSQMMRIGTHAEPDDFAEYPCSASPRMLPMFQHKHARAFPQRKSPTIQRKWPAW